MRRAIICMLVLIVLSFSCLAAKDEFDEWVYPGDTVGFDDNVFEIGGMYSGEKAYIKHEGFTTIIVKNTCQEISAYLVCFEEAVFDPEEDHGKVDYIRDAEVHHFHITIKKLMPDFSIKRTMDPKELIFGEKGTVTVTIENKGLRMAEEVVFIEELPEGVEIVSKGQLDQAGNSLTYDAGSVSTDEVINLAYAIKGEEEIDEQIEANITFKFKGNSYTETSSKLRIEITEFKSAGKVGEKVDFNEKPVLGEEFELIAEIENKDREEKLDVNSIDLYIPETVEFKRSSSFDEFEENVYRWDGAKLDPDTEKKVTADLYTAEEGSHEIFVVFDYDFDGVNYKVNKSEKFTIKYSKLDPQIELRHDNLKQILVGGLVDNIRFYLENKDDDITFYNIDVIVQGDLFEDEKIHIASIGPEERKLVKSVEYDVPYVEEEEKHEVNMSGTYETKFGEKLEFEEKEKFEITEAEFSKAVEIEHDVPRRISQGDEFDLEVEIKNIYAFRIDRLIIEDMSEGVTLLSGVKKKRIVSLGPGETVTAYVHKLRADKADMKLRTAVTYYYDGKLYKVTSDSDAEAKATKTDDEEDMDKEKNEDSGKIDRDSKTEEEKETGEKQGFFRKMIQGFRNFFRSIFS